MENFDLNVIFPFDYTEREINLKRNGCKTGYIRYPKNGINKSTILLQNLNRYQE